MASMHALTLLIGNEQLSVCRLAPREALPEWALAGTFCSITRTVDELSVVCTDHQRIPADATCEHGWRMLRVAGSQPFTLTGVLNSVLEPLAKADIGIFAISTFETDYVLVKAEKLEAAVEVLRSAGHVVEHTA
jgi:hypothetical protein